jgi:hypothetical protein
VRLKPRDVVFRFIFDHNLSQKRRVSREARSGHCERPARTAPRISPHPLKGTSFPNLLNRAAKEKGTVLFRVVLQDGDDEHKLLEILKPQHRIDFEMSAWTTRKLVNVGEDGCRQG